MYSYAIYFVIFWITLGNVGVFHNGCPHSHPLILTTQSCTSTEVSALPRDLNQQRSHCQTSHLSSKATPPTRFSACFILFCVSSLPLSATKARFDVLSTRLFEFFFYFCV